MTITPQQLSQVDSFEALAQLFYDELGWSKPNWSTFAGVTDLYGIPQDTGVKSILAVQQLSVDQTWGIFLVDFGTNRLLRSQLRLILNKVAERERQQHAERTWAHENILFICRSEVTSWTLGHYTGDKLATAKLKTFGWADPLTARTLLTRNLPYLKWQDQANWAKAWDAEALSKDFYTEYDRVFLLIESQTIHPGTPDTKRRFVQALFNRLMFLAFIERKGWLEVDGTKDYLYQQWVRFNDRGCYAHISNKALIPATFYGLLGRLFFRGLNEFGGCYPGHENYDILGTVPYLNGGLFQSDPELDVSRVEIPDEVFGEIFNDPVGLFRRYTFTVTESTPLDIDVAVDPEMLGKIFEELVTGRHESGSYYTPRPVVSFMCREALKGYFSENGIDTVRVQQLVDEHFAEDLKHGEITDLLRLLGTIRVIDPACGSGAYLLGMMRELFDLVQIVERRRTEASPRELYNIKLDIIQNNLYGVDIDPFAVNIARLRMWLSLAVDHKGKHPEPLPNLDYKIEAGDSLSVPLVSHATLPNLFASTDMDDLVQKKAQYINPLETDERQSLKAEIERIEGQVQHFLHPKGVPQGFDWSTKFVEVMMERYQAEGKTVPELHMRGFDVVLANPPYIDSETMTREQPDLRRHLQSIYTATRGNWDIYIAFFERGFNLLNRTGALLFITPDKWISKPFGDQLRTQCFSKLGEVVKLGREVFESATVDAIVSSFRNFDQPNVRVSEFTGENVVLRRTVPKALVTAPYAFDWLFSDSFEFLLSIAKLKHTLSDYGACENACATSDAYKLAEFVEDYADGDPSDAYLKIINTGTIGKYCPRWGQREMVYLGSRYKFPVVFRSKFLSEFQNTYGQKAIKPKLILKGLNLLDVCVDLNGSIIPGKTTLIVTADDETSLKMLCAILNSRIAFHVLKEKYPASSYNQGTTFTKDMINDLPLPAISADERARLVGCVDLILHRKSQLMDADVSDVQDEIDRRVEFLFLHSHEADSYDEWIAKVEAEKGTLIASVREVMASVEDDLVEFKSSVVWDTKQDKHNSVMRDEVLKEICAFLNADGGTILCGVDDGGNLLGLQKDLKHAGNKDKLGMVITNAFGDLLKPNPVELVKMKFIDIDGETILRLTVEPDRMNRYESASTKKEDVGKGIMRTHVRIHATAKALDVGDAIAWWKRRSSGTD